jgi:hypothetical protein
MLILVEWQRNYHNPSRPVRQQRYVAHGRELLNEIPGPALSIEFEETREKVD